MGYSVNAIIEHVKLGDEIMVWTYANKQIEGVLTDYNHDRLFIQHEVNSKLYEAVVDVEEIEIFQRVIRKIKVEEIRSIIKKEEHDDKQRDPD